MKRLSLRARVLLIAMALLVAGMVASSAVVLVALRKPLVEQVDLQVSVAAGVLAAVPEPVVANLAGNAPIPREGPDDLYLAYLTPDGQPSLALRGTAVPDLPKLDRAAVLARGGQPFEVADWRVLALPVRTGGSVVVAGALSSVDETVARVRLVCVLVGGGLLVVLATAGWFWVRAGLRPLRRIEETAAAIAGGDLSRRVPFTAAESTEVGRLTTALNGMLAQIEAAVAARTRSEERLRTFVADASHELRTPLAGISGFAQLYRMGGSEIDATMDRIERESTRLTALVDDLLLLAQLDEGGLDLRRAPMDLRSLAADALHDLRALDPAREVALTGLGDAPDPAPAPVLGDEARLRQVVSNLVGNAIAHTPAGSAVRIGVGTHADESILELADSGPGLSPDQVALVFDRFYRADPSRARDHGGGAGLGLAIVHSLVTAHGGTVSVSTQPGAGATFRLVLPKSG
ncbi:cell wall metabolism sensor histidine kinase WalK [Amycolatopsis sp. 195334CR]|uniref:sensor histidine kinase n=1 Tax=Amycolatopsis sp. 195334CR TaxID=2814588 RepID=UPI001A9032D7|nr:HAMP domain-containing sensor histidine kinase [Amycolatopsis sp. 195334CR]MBN6033974.1 HAMP domain-containing histidine kinase [Amycolatopsis sp. 195334CR]